MVRSVRPWRLLMRQFCGLSVSVFVRYMLVLICLRVILVNRYLFLLLMIRRFRSVDKYLMLMRRQLLSVFVRFRVIGRVVDVQFFW